MTERTKCLVPFCRHTTSRVFKEWICANHWKAISASDRRLFRRAARVRSPAAGRIWDRIKRQAIERGVGI